MLNTVRATIINNKLLDAGDVVLIGLSGGADSVALLHILNRLKAELNFSLLAAHFNHMLRGREADSDEQFCIDLCKSWGIEIHTGRANVAEFAKKEGLTIETAARILRYEFMNSLAHTKIAVAHHKNDQAETVLAHLIRGSGLKGLCGMRYMNNNIIRPLLDVTRCEIESYVRENKLDFCTDATNFLEDTTRNKLRISVIPYIEREINPKFIDSLSILADNLQSDEDFLQRLAEDAYKKCRTERGLNRIKLQRLADPIFIRVLRLAFADEGIYADIEYKHYKAIKEIITKNTNLSLDLPSIRVYTAYDELIFDRSGEKLPMEFDYEFLIGKEYKFDAFALYSKIVEGNEYKNFPDSVCLDIDKLPSDLRIRTRRAGDYIHPLGVNGKKSLKEFLIDKKIERAKRDMPLLCSDNEVLAVFSDKNYISEKLKATQSTRRMLVFFRRNV